MIENIYLKHYVVFYICLNIIIGLSNAQSTSNEATYNTPFWRAMAVIIIILILMALALIGIALYIRYKRIETIPKTKIQREIMMDTFVDPDDIALNNESKTNSVEHLLNRYPTLSHSIKTKSTTVSSDYHGP